MSGLSDTTYTHGGRSSDKLLRPSLLSADSIQLARSGRGRTSESVRSASGICARREVKAHAITSPKNSMSYRFAITQAVLQRCSAADAVVFEHQRWQVRHGRCSMYLTTALAISTRQEPARCTRPLVQVIDAAGAASMYSATRA